VFLTEITDIIPKKKKIEKKEGDGEEYHRLGLRCSH
jgi:hypothetical protein